MSKVFEKAISIQKILQKNLVKKILLIVSADIENQINELESSLRKKTIWK